MITPNVTGMSPRNLHAYEGLQYYNKMPDKILWTSNQKGILVPQAPFRLNSVGFAK
jgi:hypothetical protein